MSDAEVGGVLRLRNLIDNIRRAQDPAWREQLEQQQVLARLGRRFAHSEDPLEAMLGYAHARKAEFDVETPSGSSAKGRTGG